MLLSTTYSQPSIREKFGLLNGNEKPPSELHQLQAQYSKLGGGSKSTAKSQWEKVEALRASINKQLVEAESSVQETYNSASSYLQQSWDSLKAKAEL